MRLLTGSTVDRYVNLTSMYTRLPHQNTSAYANLVRLALLTRYGGLWVDGTLCPSKSVDDSGLPLDRDALMYHVKPRGDGCGYPSLDLENLDSLRITSNWFLYSRTANDPLYTSLSEYFRQMQPWVVKHPRAFDYHWFHHGFGRLVATNHSFWNMVAAMPFLSARDDLEEGPHRFAVRNHKVKLCAPLDNATQAIICNGPWFKLTYKKDVPDCLDDASSVLSFIVRLASQPLRRDELCEGVSVARPQTLGAPVPMAKDRFPAARSLWTNRGL